jgi:3-hydroxybutyrate dehydrogenase
MRFEEKVEGETHAGIHLKDKICIVTGAASGIGKEIALAFAGEGGKVAIADLNKKAAQSVVDEISGVGGRAMAVGMDVTDEAQVQNAVTEVVARYGRVDVPVSNAGIQIVHPLESFPFADWKKMLAIHLDGAFLTTRACLPQCRLRAVAAASFTWARCTPRKPRC